MTMYDNEGNDVSGTDTKADVTTDMDTDALPAATSEPKTVGIYPRLDTTNTDGSFQTKEQATIAAPQEPAQEQKRAKIEPLDQIGTPPQTCPLSAEQTKPVETRDQADQSASALTSLPESSRPSAQTNPQPAKETNPLETSGTTPQSFSDPLKVTTFQEPGTQTSTSSPSFKSSGTMPQTSTKMTDSPEGSEAPARKPEAMEVTEESADQGEPEAEGREYTVLIVGKTGNGKSSLVNTLMGAKLFKVGRGMFTATTETQHVTRDVSGKRLKVIDTPDFTNLTTYPASAQQLVNQWKQLTNSSPDVIILVVRCDVRYTKEEYDIYREIVKLWGDDPIFRQRLMVAFTFGDLQDEDLEKELQNVSGELKSVLREAKDRYVQVNNRAKDEEAKQQRELLCKQLENVFTQNEELTKANAKSVTVVLLGKTGRGKSSLGNLLLGRPPHFPEGTGLSTLTTASSAHSVDVWGRTLKVIDTPDLQLVSPSNKRQEIERWRTLALQGPIIFLLVLRCDLKCSPEDLAIIQDVKDHWGQTSPGSDCRWLVAFTFSDRMDYKLEEDVGKCPELNGVLRETDGLYIAVNSKDSAVERRKVVNLLLSCVDGKGVPPTQTIASGTMPVSEISTRKGTVGNQLTRRPKPI